MLMANSEQDARIVIDELLRKAGWDMKDRLTVRTAVPVYESGVVAETQSEYGIRTVRVVMQIMSYMAITTDRLLLSKLRKTHCIPMLPNNRHCLMLRK